MAVMELQQSICASWFLGSNSPVHPNSSSQHMNHRSLTPSHAPESAARTQLHHCRVQSSTVSSSLLKLGIHGAQPLTSESQNAAPMPKCVDSVDKGTVSRRRRSVQLQNCIPTLCSLMVCRAPAMKNKSYGAQQGQPVGWDVSRGFGQANSFDPLHSPKPSSDSHDGVSEHIAHHFCLSAASTRVYRLCCRVSLVNALWFRVHDVMSEHKQQSHSVRVVSVKTSSCFTPFDVTSLKCVSTHLQLTV